MAWAVLRVSNNYKNRLVKRVALCGGNGSSFLKTAYDMQADVLLTADTKWSDFLWAYENKMIIVSPTHYKSEHCFVKLMKDIVEKELRNKNIPVLSSEAQDTEQFV